LDSLSTLPSAQIKDCNHTFHHKCIEDCLNREPKCPVCRAPVGEPQGRCPSGTMTIETSKQPCPGFSSPSGTTTIETTKHQGRGFSSWRSKKSTTTIEILYSIPQGTQRAYHENPSSPYQGTSRKAYLPNNEEGRRLLTRLKFAWTHGLTFTIGSSLTTGQRNCVVWTSIHHKTSLQGGPHAFPDPKYIDNCNESLDALNVPKADTGCDVRNESIPYDAPRSLATSSAITGALQPLQYTAVVNANCSICLDSLSKFPSVKTKACSHAFHHKCITDCLTLEPRCPVCRAPVGDPQGRSPSGSMSIDTNKRHSCPGFSSSTTTIEILYSIPGGTQRSYHENPGNSYQGTTRMAYLPNNKQGTRLLTRLKFAWTHGLAFTIGTSVTTGQRGSVIWNSSIPHKTSLHGGLYGFPDPTYSTKCNEALDALGVPDADACHF
jgi:deltex-like protein